MIYFNSCCVGGSLRWRCEGFGGGVSWDGEEIWSEDGDGGAEVDWKNGLG